MKVQKQQREFIPKGLFIPTTKPKKLLNDIEKKECMKELKEFIYGSRSK